MTDDDEKQIASANLRKTDLKWSRVMRSEVFHRIVLQAESRDCLENRPSFLLKIG